MIVMTLVVRDEVDILRANIDHHLALGVDHFLVADNGSVDGTLDVLNDYRNLGVLDFVEKGDVQLNQEVWRGELVQRAIEIGAEWVISNDADEFYSVTGTGTLEETLNASGSRVVTCSRRNMVSAYDRLAPGNWQTELRYCSMNTPRPPKDHYDPTTPMPMPFFYYDLHGKVIFKPEGFIALGNGAHEVTLEGNPQPAKASIFIRHYPLRDPAEFLASIPRFVEQARKARKGPRQSGKYHRWLRMLESGVDPDQVLAEALPSSMRLAEDLQTGLVKEAPWQAAGFAA